MSVYIIRPKMTSAVRSLKLRFRKFSPESRPAQVAEVVHFWQEDRVHRDIESWLEDAENISKHPSYSGITGATIVEMSDEEAVRMRRELPNALILRDQPLTLIQPERNVVGTKDEVTPAELWHLEAISLNTVRQQGFTGTGKNITVAVLDTGIDDRHPELQGKIVESYSLNDRTQKIQLTSSQDTDGHGTHVAGLICGQQVGVAPETKLINGVLIPRGTGKLSDLFLWLDWLGTRQDVNIANISAGIPKYFDEINDLIDTLLAVGILPVCAVGNDGIYRTDAPANCRGAVSVGAANSHGKVTHFSGSGIISINNHLYNNTFAKIMNGKSIFAINICGKHFY